MNKRVIFLGFIFLFVINFINAAAPVMNTTEIDSARMWQRLYGNGTFEIHYFIYDNYNLTGYCNATDSDSGNVTYYYQWYRNNSFYSGGVTPVNYTAGLRINVANISNVTTTAGENWIFNCMANDGTSNSSWLNNSIWAGYYGEILIVNQPSFNITNCTDLQNLNYASNGTYNIINNINCSETQTWNWNETIYKGFDTISPIYVNVTLEGGNYNISGLYINRPSQNEIGLIGVSCGTYFAINNLYIVNGNITGNYSVGGIGGYVNDNITNSSFSGTINGYQNVGGLAGTFYNMTCRNCSSSGNVTASYQYAGGLESLGNYYFIYDSHSSSNVVSAGDYAGGLVAYHNYAYNINNSYATGNVISGGQYGGGFVGRINNGATYLISNSYATGNVVCTNNNCGGFVGNVVSFQINKSYATGNVSGNNTVGGFAGNIGASSSVNNSYATGNASAFDYVGGFVGKLKINLRNVFSTGYVSYTLSNKGGLVGYDNTGGNCTNCFWDNESSGLATSVFGTGKTTAQMKTQTTFTDAGWDFCNASSSATWCIDENRSYPCLNWKYPGCTCDDISPLVIINSPTATTYTSALLSINVNTNENSTCNYSINAGATNFSLTSNSTGTGHTATKTSLSNANYVLNVYCSDLSGNLNNSMNVSFTLAVPVTEDSSNLGGGSVIYFPSNEQMSNGYSKKLKEGYKIKFEFENQTYYLTIKKVKNNKVKLELSGNYSDNLDLKVNETLKFDLDSDGNSYDFEISLNEINDNYADLNLKLITEEIPAEPEKEVSKEVQEEIPKQKNKNNFWIWVVAGIILAEVVLEIVLRKKRLEKKKQNTIKIFKNSLGKKLVLIRKKKMKITENFNIFKIF